MPNKYQTSLESILTVYLSIENQEIDKQNPDNIYTVEKLYLHEDYDPVNFLNDIALLRLNEEVVKSVKADWICLPTNKTFNLINSTVYTAGFGVTSPYSQELSNILQQVSLQVYQFSTCNLSTIGLQTDSNSQFCAGNLRESKDTCQGDSGSPVMYNYLGIWYVIGIVSYGKGCAINTYAGINYFFENKILLNFIF